jgi:hypothetical protein
MTTQILRTIDRWRFETPLSVALGASAGFIALTAPVQLFHQIPMAGDMGVTGRAIVAVLLAAVAGGAGYVAMRKPVKTEPAPVDPFADVPEEERPSGMPAERFARFRRADMHPDAPPREPIIASRDLGEPFMDVATPAPVVEPEPQADQQWWPDASIPDADYVEVPEVMVARTTEPVDAPEIAEIPVEEPKLAWPVEPAVTEPHVGKTSISAMMDRLSTGLERRASAPPRDPTPALRDALAELNRLAERRD